MKENEIKHNSDLQVLGRRGYHRLTAFVGIHTKINEKRNE